MGKIINHLMVLKSRRIQLVPLKEAKRGAELQDRLVRCSF